MAVKNKRVEEFLAQVTDDFSDLKESAGEVRGELTELAGGYVWKLRPWDHQAVSIFLGLCYPQFMFYHDMGAGKGMIAISTIAIRKHLGELRGRTLVVCPNLVTSVWEAEVPKFSNLSFRVLAGTTIKKDTDLLQASEDIQIISYTALRLICTKRVGTGKKARTVVDLEKVAAIGNAFDAMILDESQFVKSREALTTQVVVALSYSIEYRYALTGTPFHNPMDLWSQHLIIDGGESLGKNITMFRKAFFQESVGRFGGFEYFLKPSMEPALKQRMKHRSIRYEADEFESLPPLVTQVVHLPLEKKAAAEYKQTQQRLDDAAGDPDALENVFMRMRQLCSGFIDSKQGGAELLVQFGESSKISWLRDFVESLGTGRKVVVFTEFRYTASLIKRMLEKARVGHVHLTAKNLQPALEAFNTDDRCRILIVNTKSGSAGLNLQAASMEVFFESPCSVITRKQAEKRVHRSGQTRTCFRYDLVTQGTVEQKIFEGLQDGISVLDRLLNGGTL